MTQFVYDSWNAIMDHRINPLRHIPDLQVRHMVMQVLAFMWSSIFAIMIAESVFAFGVSAIAHLIFVAGVVITVATFKVAEHNPKAFYFKKGYHSPGRARSQVMYLSDKGKLEKVKLDPNDPGGEHE
jgi:hypothetical protein